MEIKEEKKYGENVKNKGKINWTYKKKKKKKERKVKKKMWGERRRIGGIYIYVYVITRLGKFARGERGVWA